MDSIWYTLLSIAYVVVCVFLIFVVLIQGGKGGGMGAAFGGSTQTFFGGAGAGNFLTRLTAIGAFLFMVFSSTLARMSSGSDRAFERAAQAAKAAQAKGKAVKAKPVAPVSAAGAEQVEAETAGTKEADAVGADAKDVAAPVLADDAAKAPGMEQGDSRPSSSSATDAPPTTEVTPPADVDAAP